MRHLSLTQKPVLGKTALLAVMAVTVGVIARALYVANEVVGQLTGKYEALTAASCEPEINAVETAAAAGKYLMAGDHQFRDAFAKDSAEFLASMAQFDRATDRPKLKKDGMALQTLSAHLSGSGLGAVSRCRWSRNSRLSCACR
jgi:hypothetical protein